MVEPSTVLIKGIKDGLLVTLGDGDWPGVQNALIESLEKKSSFFQGARMAMEVGNRELQPVELRQLCDKLTERGISLWALRSTNLATEQTARVLGLDTKLPIPRSGLSGQLSDNTVECENGVFLRKSLQSGFKLSSQCHVTVLGDVRPGAEVIARGSVIIWGRARGSIIAGADGDETALVCALSLEPAKLRIANIMADVLPKGYSHQPVCAMIRDGEIVLEPWKAREH
jgi:septum site-determining protein MinC